VSPVDRDQAEEADEEADEEHADGSHGGRVRR
jgi:hypothetical protein